MISVVWGTRPEVRKLRTLIAGLRGQGVPVQLVSTDQHPDLTADLRTDPVFAGTVHLGLPNVGGLDPEDYGRLLAEALEAVLTGDLVVVQGDTASAWAGAKAAQRLGLPLYHVEAGVRTGDRANPWPEEGFRIEIDRWADAGCCATLGNQQALGGEGKDITRFPVLGNPGIDALLADQSPVSSPWPHVLVTLHRRESFGPRLDATIRALADWATQHPATPLYWPVHPNPAVRDALTRAGTLPPSLVLLPPLPARPFLQLLAHALVIVTDSGGVQEEAAALGVPCLVSRQVTDRPESVAEGLALLVPDPTTLPIALSLAASPGGLRAVPSHTFGDGHTTPRILTHLQSLYPSLFSPSFPTFPHP